MAAEMAAIGGDVTGLQQLNYTSSCWEDQRLFSEGKIASKHCNISKTLGRGSIYPPLVPWWEVWFCVYVRGLSGSLKLWRGIGWFCMRLHFFIKASYIIDTKGLYCVTKGIISFSSLLFCFRSAAFLLWVLLPIAIFLSKLCASLCQSTAFWNLKYFLRGVCS